MIDGIEIIDSHVHTFASDDIADKIISSFNKLYDIEFKNPGNGTVDNVLKNMESVGTDRTIMANFAPPKIIDQNNMWTLDTACSSAGRLIPLVSFHPEMEGSLSEHLERYIRMGAKGIKLHPMAQGFDIREARMNELYEQCNERRFPLLIHCGRVANARLNGFSDFECIVPVMEEFPHMPVILAHMADGNMECVMEASRKYENVYFDTSIVITGYPDIINTNEPSWPDDAEVVSIINEIGAHKVLFGSDFPWGSPVHDLKRIMNLKLDLRQKQLIFNKNARKIYQLD